MPRFDRILIADWSASGALSPARPCADAIWLGETSAQGSQTRYYRSRATAEAAIAGAIADAKAAGARLLIGCDFPFGYPQGFAQMLTGKTLGRRRLGASGRPHHRHGEKTKTTAFRLQPR